MKAFFVHYSRESRRTDSSARRHLPKGFTAYVQEVTDPAVPNRERLVMLSITYCSNKDEFSKKAGRQEVQRLVPETVNKRDVPRLLAAAEGRVENLYPLHESNYFYVLKYMV